MNPERLDIARRLVACPKWMWLPGMHLGDPDDEGWSARIVTPTEWVATCPPVSLAGTRFDGAPPSPRLARMPALDGFIPDLDDELTRLGLLAVVRQAYGCVVYTRPAFDEIGWVVVRADDPTRDIRGDVSVAWGPTEEAVLLAALQAAP